MRQRMDSLLTTPEDEEDCVFMANSPIDSVRFGTKNAKFVSFSVSAVHFHTALSQTNKTV